MLFSSVTGEGPQLEHHTEAQEEFQCDTTDGKIEAVCS